MNMQKIRTFAAKTVFIALATVTLLVTTVAAADLGSGKITASALRVRESATTESAILTLIPNGTTVELLAEEGDWYLTNYSGFMGYISKEYVQVVPMIAAESTSETTSTASTQEIKQDVIHIGRNIREIRLERGIGQTELVRRLQLQGVAITRETLVKIERGTQHIQAAQLRGIRDALSTTYDELLK